MPVVVKGFAFGLHWYATTSDSSDELQVRAKKLKANVYAEAEHESGRMFGFASIKKWKSVRAAAAAVGETLPDGGVFIHTLDKKGTTCLIVIDKDRRLPVPGLDIFGPREKMVDAANAYIASVPEELIRVYGDAEMGEINGAHEVLRMDLERIATDAVIAGLLKPVSEKDAKWILAPLLIIGLSAVAYSEEIGNLISPQATTTVTPMQAYKNQVKAAVDGVLQLNQFPSSVMAGFMPFLATVNSEADGWHIDGLKCAASECEVTWRRREGATSEGFLRAMHLQATDTTVWFPDMDTAKRKLSFSKGEPSTTLLLAPNATFAQVVGTWFQGLSDRGLPKANIGQLQPIISPNGVNVPAGEIPQFGQYQFTVPFNESDLQAVAGLPNLMTIENIELRREGAQKMTVQFNGKYYAL